jgi:hypothetical protein
MLAGQLQRTIHDVDIFWQLKLGELTLAGGLPRTEPFLAGRDHEPLAVVAWLGQVVFAAVRLVGGWDLLRLFDAALWLGGFAVVGASVARRVTNQWVVVIGLWVGWFAAVGFASIRPQTFAVFGFGLLVVLVRSGLPDRSKVALGAVLLLLWQNLHPSALVGGAYLGAAAAGEWALYLFGRGMRPGLARLVLVPIAAAVTVATPAGSDIYRISAENRDRCVWEELRITEWLPLWEFFPQVGRDQASPMVLATVVLMAVRGRRSRAVDLLPAAALTLMTLLTFRFVLFWGISIIPVWAQCLGRESPPAVTTVWRVRRVVAAAGFLVALLPLLVWPLNFDGVFPFKGVAALKAENVRGAVYTSYFWGGIVTDSGYPDWHPTHDGRYYVFSRDELAYHFAAGRGEVPLAELVERFHPVAFFLFPGRDDGLAARLKASPEWRPVYEDDRRGYVFVRNDPARDRYDR